MSLVGKIKKFYKKEDKKLCVFAKEVSINSWYKKKQYWCKIKLNDFCLYNKVNEDVSECWYYKKGKDIYEIYKEKEE